MIIEKTFALEAALIVFGHAILVDEAALVLYLEHKVREVIFIQKFLISHLVNFQHLLQNIGKANFVKQTQMDINKRI